MRRRMESLVVARAWAWGTILLAGTRTTRVGAMCLLPSMSIETTTGGLSISGCYRETVYLGLYQTIVWTLEGQDIMDTGTAAIVADLGGSLGTDPVWTIGTVASHPLNTWSDGYGAGIDLQSTACIGESPFWETVDPTEETLWKCDSNKDGILSSTENGDFASIYCGCPDENGVLETSPPTPAALTSVTSGTSLTSATSSVGNPTPAATAPPVNPTPAATAPPVNPPTPARGTEPTLPPLPISQPTRPTQPTQPTQPEGVATPAPSTGLLPAAAACNITIISETLRDVSGCYAGRVSSNSKGSWVQLDESSRIEWQEAVAPDAGYWAIILNGFGVPDTEKCISDMDENDPTDIPAARWYCDSNGDGEPAANERGDFSGLECSAACLSATAGATSAAAAGDGSSSGVDSKTAIVAGSVVGAVVLVGLLAVAAILLMRRKKRVDSEVVGPVDGEAATAEAAPPPAVPVFEPWGSRPPPKYFGSS